MPPRIGPPAMRLPIVTMRLPSAILESPCIEGEPGIGKSTPVRAAVAEEPKARCQVF